MTIVYFLTTAGAAQEVLALALDPLQRALPQEDLLRLVDHTLVTVVNQVRLIVGLKTFSGHCLLDMVHAPDACCIVDAMAAGISCPSRKFRPLVCPHQL